MSGRLRPQRWVVTCLVLFAACGNDAEPVRTNEVTTTTYDHTNEVTTTTYDHTNEVTTTTYDHGDAYVPASCWEADQLPTPPVYWPDLDRNGDGVSCEGHASEGTRG